MTNWFYYDNNTAEKRGPFNAQVLKNLAANGTIQLNTIIENENGQTMKIEDIPELKGIIEGRSKTVPPPLPQFDSAKKEFNDAAKKALDHLAPMFNKISEQSEKIPWLKKIPIRKILTALILCTVLGVGVLFGLRFLFAEGPLDIDKPTPNLIANADKENPRACLQLINYYGKEIPDYEQEIQSRHNRSQEFIEKKNEIRNEIMKKIKRYAQKGAKLADNGNPYAQICKGYTYSISVFTNLLNGDDTKEDIRDDLRRSLKWFRKAAEQGNAEGKVQFVECLNLVKKLPDLNDSLKLLIVENDDNAEEWLLDTAEQGYTRAQVLLAEFYLKGSTIGIKKDDQEAFEWIYKAAKNGNADAEKMLVITMFLEDISEQDREKAFNLLYKKVTPGWLPNLFGKKKKEKEKIENLALLQANIGFCYEKGKGVRENKPNAFKWYRKAAEAEHAEAQYQVGKMYDEGEGVKENKSEAFKWYQKAAEKGKTLAQYRIAQMYDEGEGTKENRDEAKIWYKKVVENDDDDSFLIDKQLRELKEIKALSNQIENEQSRIENAKEKAFEKVGREGRRRRSITNQSF
jgi:TPR repeat protein